MAKLNVVIPAVEVTVDVEGKAVTYRKVDRKGQAGDIVKALKSEVDLTEGAFYGPLYRNGVGNLGFYDDVDDFRYSLLKNYASQFEVFAPNSEPDTVTKSETITFEGAEWRKVDRDVRAGDAIKFTDEDRSSYLTESELYVVDRIDSCDDPQITDDDGDEYDAGCEDYEVYEKVVVEYREVKRKANVGDKVRIVARLRETDPYNNGDILTVSERISSFRVTLNVNGVDAIARDEEFVVLETVTAESAKPERLAVGDYARVVSVTRSYIERDVSEGSIVKITQDDELHRPFQAELTNGKMAGWFTESELVRATDEEVAAAKREDLLTQFTVGDTVKLTIQAGKNPHFGYGSVDNGDIGKVTEVFRTHIVVDFSPKQRSWKADPTELTKLSAEEVAEIERKQAEETKWAAIGRNVNEFKRGDIVEVTITNSGHAVGTIGELVSGSHFAIPTEFGVRANGSTKCHLSGLKLVTPVEQRFDMEEVDAA